jgi:hypothetical protein
MTIGNILGRTFKSIPADGGGGITEKAATRLRVKSD